MNTSDLSIADLPASGVCSKLLCFFLSLHLPQDRSLSLWPTDLVDLNLRLLTIGRDVGEGRKKKKKTQIFFTPKFYRYWMKQNLDPDVLMIEVENPKSLFSTVPSPHSQGVKRSRTAPEAVSTTEPESST